MTGHRPVGEVDRGRHSRLSADSGTPARFIVSELYDTPEVLDEKFDIVYTGVGAICWIPEIRGWAEVVSSFLEPGAPSTCAAIP